MSELTLTVTSELVEELTKLFHDKDFIDGMLAYAATDSDRKVLLDFIREGNDVDIETVTVLAIHLSNSRKSFLQQLREKIFS